MKKFCLLFLIILVLSSCPGQKKENNYLAKVNDERLTYEEFKSSFDDETWNTMSRREKEDHIQEWVTLTSLAQKCDETGISDMPLIRERIKNATKKLKANTLIANQLSTIKTTEEELLDYYHIHKSEYLKKITEYKYQRILITDADKFSEAVKYLKTGVTFKEAAQKYSEEAAGKSGGYMGFVSEIQVEPEIWKTLNELKQYKWKSVKIGEKYYLLRWYDKRTATIEKNFSELKDVLRKKLRQEKRDEKYKELMQEIERNYDVEINYLTDGEDLL